MKSRKPTRGGLVKDLPSAFLGTRQPPGLAPEARALLASHGHIIEVVDAEMKPTEVRQPDVAGGERLDAAVIEHDPPAHAETSPAPRRASKKSRVSSAKRAPRPKQSAPASSEARAQEYRLPPVGGSRKKTRSHHFRLPEDVEARLDELASAHECSQTRVVCAAIVAESERFRRRQAREPAGQVTPVEGGVDP